MAKAGKLYASENLYGVCLRLPEIGVGFRISNTPLLQHSKSMSSSAASYRAPSMGPTKARSFGSGFFT